MKSKRSDDKSNIMPKRYVILSKNILFSNAGKTGNVPELEYKKFLKSIFWRCNIYIVTTAVLWILNKFIYFTSTLLIFDFKTNN